MRIFKEIKLVGLKDWLWFTLILRRNEFHKSLDLNSIDEKYLQKLAINRKKAHEIDMKLSDLQRLEVRPMSEVRFSNTIKFTNYEEDVKDVNYRAELARKVFKEVIESTKDDKPYSSK